MDQSGPGPLDFPTAFAAWRNHCRHRRLRRSEARELGDVLLHRLSLAGWPETIDVAFHDLDECEMDRRAYQFAAEIMMATGVWLMDTQPGRPSRWECRYDALLATVAADPVAVAAPKRVVQQKPVAVQQLTPPAPPPPEPVQQVAQPTQQPSPTRPAPPADDPMRRAYDPTTSANAHWHHKSPSAEQPGATVGVTDEQRAIEASPMWAACERWVKGSEDLPAQFWAPMTRAGYLSILAPKPIPIQVPSMEPELLLEALKRTRKGAAPAYTQKILSNWRDTEILTVAALKALDKPKGEEVQKPPQGPQLTQKEIDNDPALQRQRKIAEGRAERAAAAGRGAGMITTAAGSSVH